MRRFFLFIPLFLLAGIVAKAQLGAEPDYPTRQNLGPSVNTNSVEILPVVSPDGKTLYFDRKYDSANVGGAADDDDIYYSTLRNDGTWAPAKNIGPPLNTRGSDVLFWISVDGNTALVHNGDLANDKSTGLGISRREAGGWGKPLPITIDSLTELGDNYYAYISPDQKRMILSIHRGKEDPDDYDLFVCEAKNNDLLEWREPQPISVLNSTEFDGAPFIASDNKTLYFNSDRPGGFGETDILFSKRVGDSWLQWTPPKYLGDINTPVAEASISIPAQGDYAYISGTGFFGEAFYGRSDLFRIKLPDSLRPSPVSIIIGRMLIGDRGLEGLVRAETPDGKRQINSTASDSYGRFILLLPQHEQVHITGFVQEYGETGVNIRTGGKEQPSQTVILNFDSTQASPRASDTDITASLLIGPIRFVSGSSDLTPTALEELQHNVASLKGAIQKGDVVRVAITGYTDDVGETDSNQALSLQRAGSVRRWLIANGISPRLISTDARGEANPVESNETEQGRAANRRVEVRVIAPRK